MPAGLPSRRSLLLAMLALAVPLPALGLSSGGVPQGAPVAPAPLAVSTSLDSCGLASSQVVCKLDVSFDAVPGATSYTAAVTRADGSVADYGSIGAGGTSLWVPYVGPGTYSVRVSAFGTPPAAEETGSDDAGNLISSGTAKAKPRQAGQAGNAAAAASPGARVAPQGPNATATGDPGADPGAPSSSCDPQATVPPPTPAEPLPPEPPADLDPADADEDGDGIDDAKERADYELALSERARAALEAEAALPQGVECATATAR